ncbi:MAG: nucleotidyltransferase family protein [Defluviitaleaceae bacterium]|nr:nucleotidyltransferase family protein [Defluviitaleaceae bacterium]
MKTHTQANKTLGIIVEYNPLHTGHASHLAKSKAATDCDTVVAVMSGNFVQRGEPAICDKWQRTKMALLAGADLVIELPTYYAAAGAEYFARGAVTLLEKTGIIDYMCFGSEWADINALKACANALSVEDDDFKIRLHEYLRQGLSYPAARAKAMETLLPDTPNNILGVEYIKALIGLNSKIEPCTVPRSPVSAKDLRSSLKEDNFSAIRAKVEINCPPFVWEILNESIAAHGPASLDSLSPLFHYILRTHSPEELQPYVDVSEGLENRLIRCAEENQLISDIVTAAKTKRYTYLRLQRAILHIILGITKKQMTAYEVAGGPQYIRVLGFKRERTDLLRLLEKQAALPMVINLKNAQLPSLAAQMLEEEIQATKVYSLAYPKHVYFNEYSMPCVVL